MKFNKIAVSVLCLFTVAICANAQAVKAPKKDAKTSAKLENILQKRALQARKTAKAEKCRWCGEAVVEGRKCPADPDVYCMPAPKAVKAQKVQKYAEPAQEQQTSCPKCGEEYDIDVLCHGIPHECDNSGEPANLVSVRGYGDPHYGEPEMAPSQELDLSIANQAEVLLQKDRDANNGRAKHTFEYYYNQVAQQSANTEECRWCGEPVVEGHRCPADPDVNCMGPVSATTYHEANTVSTVKATETHCPKCGVQYSIDELYHGMQHHCETK